MTRSMDSIHPTDTTCYIGENIRAFLTRLQNTKASQPYLLSYGHVADSAAAIAAAIAAAGFAPAAAAAGSAAAVAARKE